MSRTEYAGAAITTTVTSSLTASVPGDGQTFTIAAGTGYPTGSVGNFVLKVDSATASEEKILCSGRTGLTVTVAAGGRGYDGTTAVSHGGGVTAGTVQHCIDATSLTDNQDHVYDDTRDDHTQYLKIVSAAELIRDTMGAALTAGTGITLTVDDAGNIITITNSSPAVAIGTIASSLFAATTVAGAESVANDNAFHAPATPCAVSLSTGTAVTVDLSAEHYNVGGGANFVYTGVRVGGATTRVPALTNGIQEGVMQYAGTRSGSIVLTGLTAGTNTFAMEHAQSGSNSPTWGLRYICVRRLN